MGLRSGAGHIQAKSGNRSKSPLIEAAGSGGPDPTNEGECTPMATGINQQTLLDECVRHLQALIRLDTSNPPGNEIIAARYIASQLETEGIPYEIVESE